MTIPIIRYIYFVQQKPSREILSVPAMRPSGQSMVADEKVGFSRNERFAPGQRELLNVAVPGPSQRDATSI